MEDRWDGVDGGVTGLGSKETQLVFRSLKAELLYSYRDMEPSSRARWANAVGHLVTVLEEFENNPVDHRECSVQFAIDLTYRFLARIERPGHRIVSYALQ